MVWPFIDVIISTPTCFTVADKHCAVHYRKDSDFIGNPDMFKPAEHFCKVAKINHEVVDERFRKMDALVK